MNMQVETAKYTKELGIKKVGLLAASDTINNQLYHNALNAYGITVIKPNDHMQKLVMKGIFKIKSGEFTSGTSYLEEAAQALLDEGAEAIISGCTEVPIALNKTDAFKLIDATKITANSVIKLADE